MCKMYCWLSLMFDAIKLAILIGLLRIFLSNYEALNNIQWISLFYVRGFDFCFHLKSCVHRVRNKIGQFSYNKIWLLLLLLSHYPLSSCYLHMIHHRYHPLHHHSGSRMYTTEFIELALVNDCQNMFQLHLVCILFTFNCSIWPSNGLCIVPHKFWF